MASDFLITAAFDGGNIEVVDASDASNIQLKIRKDGRADFMQWFYFRLLGARDQDCRLRILNAHEATYKDGYVDYRAAASYDRQHWFRVPNTTFDGTELVIRHRVAHDRVDYAYFAPYAMERHDDLIARALKDDRVRLESLGVTLDGQSIDYLQVGAAESGKPNFWWIARQHPGETMAEHWMEGFMERLLDDADPVAKSLVDRAVFHVVPNMNPDGSRRGHLRTNAAGTNLNRAWNAPSLKESPEVLGVRKRMEETGVDFFLDVHGDEGLPYNFIAGARSIPSVTERQVALLERFQSELATRSPDFQTEHGYPVPPPGKSNLAMATPWVAERFGCLSMTLEQPFKDTANHPMPDEGWSPRRARRFGAAVLDVVHVMYRDLRAEK